MRIRIAILLLLVSISVKSQDSVLETFFNQADAFFKSYVNEKGLVDYKSVESKQTDLNELTKLIGTISLEQASSEELQAFYINTYNVLVIDAVMSSYPVSSPNVISGFFTSLKHNVASKKITLDQLEKDVLFGIKKDARFHFALVCGALGCPPLKQGAFMPQSLEEDLEAITKKAILTDHIVEFDDEQRQARISEIFKWYKSDFLIEHSSIEAFIASYRNLPSDYTFSFQTYDWNLNDGSSKEEVKPEELSNIVLFTPSALLRKGQIEVINFNNIYTQNRERNSEGEIMDLAQRQSFLTSIWQFTYGLTANGRFNAGFEFNLNRSRYGDRDLSPLSIFGFEDGDFARNAFSAIGPRIKFLPFTKIPRFSIQSTLLLPVAAELEDPQFTAHDRYTWFTQLFFDHTFGTDWQVFLEADALYRFKRYEFQNDFFRLPLSAFVSYFPSSKATIYVQSQYSPRFDIIRQEGVQNATLLTGWFTQIGIGGKYQITRKLNLEASYTNFVLSRSAGAGSTFNFGFRFLR